MQLDGPTFSSRLGIPIKRNSETSGAFKPNKHFPQVGIKGGKTLIRYEKECCTVSARLPIFPRTLQRGRSELTPRDVVSSNSFSQKSSNHFQDVPFKPGKEGGALILKTPSARLISSIKRVSFT